MTKTQHWTETRLWIIDWDQDSRSHKHQLWALYTLRGHFQGTESPSRVVWWRGPAVQQQLLHPAWGQKTALSDEGNSERHRQADTWTPWEAPCWSLMPTLHLTSPVMNWRWKICSLICRVQRANVAAGQLLTLLSAMHFYLAVKQNKTLKTQKNLHFNRAVGKEIVPSMVVNQQ